MSNKFPTLRIEPGSQGIPLAIGCRIFIGDFEIQSVKKLELTMGVSQPNIVKLEFMANVNIESLPIVVHELVSENERKAI